MANPRVAKIADRIQVIVAQMLERRIKDPRIGFVTVTDVRVTGDTQQATVFYTALDAAPVGKGGDVSSPSDETRRAEVAAALESAKGLIRSEVAKQLGMRHAPSIEFVHDALPENARQLDDVLARAKELDEQLAAARGTNYAGDQDPYKKPKVIDEDDADEGEAAENFDDIFDETGD